MQRFFNTAGPCDPRFHYMLPAAERLPQVPELVATGGYFAVHAPRQTGKTTTLRALARMLTAGGQYAALHVSCEVGRSTPDDLPAVQRAILGAIANAAEDMLPPELQPPPAWPERDPLHILTSGLRAWARACPRPLVLFLDEIDALRGQSLINVLSQLRAAYPSRPESAPWSVALCGLRDVRDYKAASGGDAERMGTSSPFNIKVASLRLGDFTQDEVAALYAQHTQQTGQAFTSEAAERAFALTRGQPWLVNALAREILHEMHIAAPAPITAEHVETAKERLILARATHLDSLVARLHEERVRAVIEPLLAGTTIHSTAYNDDVSYVRDLGLVAPGRWLEIANPIYREVIVRVLAESVEDYVQPESRQFRLPDGRLDMRALLHAFAEFWREQGDVLTGNLSYHEVAPQLVLMAFLQRIVNGGGFIDREYGLGRYRIDLLIRWPYIAPTGQRQWQREALELKVWRDKKRDPKDKGLIQLGEYLGQLGLEHGTLVLFDRRSSAPPLEERIAFEEAQAPGGHAVTILRA